jgi:cytochrome P450
MSDSPKRDDVDATIELDDELLSPDRVRDPYPYFSALQEHDPVRWNERYRAWVVTRYDDVSAAFRDPRYSSDRIGALEAARGHTPSDDGFDRVLKVLSDWMVFKDPPDHTRLRRLVQKAFTIKSVESWRERIQQIVSELIDQLDTSSNIDLVAEVASPLPAIVIAEMLGVPPEDRLLFKEWSDQITSLVFGAFDQPDRRQRAIVGMTELVDYLSALIHSDRVVVGDDLMGSLIAARDDSDALTTDEVLSTCVLLLFGGHETTTSLIGSAVLALLDHPGEMDRLRNQPELATSAIEEFLRYDGPAKVSVRIAREEVDIRGRLIKPGQRVFLSPNAANRDPRRFDRPHALDVGRADAAHLGFGAGIHYCLGAPLARLEGSLAIQAIVNRINGMELVDREALEWQPMLLSRSLRSLPVRIDSVSTNG